MLIDYATPEGKIRMMLGDVSDLPYLPSSVYTAVYEESGNNLNRATTTCGKMILAQMSYQTHRSMGLQLQVWGNQAFEQMKQYLLMIVKDPAFSSDGSPVPYSASGTELNPILQFQQDWRKNYYSGDQSQQLARDAAVSPNDGSLYGTGF